MESLKDYLSANELSIYALSKQSGVPYSTLNDLANGKVTADNCKVRAIRRLAEALGLTMEEVCAMCEGETRCVLTESGVAADITVRGKSFYVTFTHEGRRVEERLCRVDRNSRQYVEEMAAWRIEEYMRKTRMKGFR